MIWRLMSAPAILGISCFYHDSAAAMVCNGEIAAAVQEERFTRKKHDSRFPSQGIRYCLEHAGLTAKDLAAVAFYDNPMLSLERLLKTILHAAPDGMPQWLEAAPSFLGRKLFISRMIRSHLGIEAPILFARHHLSHAASAFYPSPFERAAILSVDGVGEWATTSIAYGEGDDIRVMKEVNFPHSLGLLYSAFTYFCGFKVNSGEYKLMGLAPYGKPKYADRIREELIQLKADGSFRLNMEFFGYLRDNLLTNEAFYNLLGGPPRPPESRITRREMDLAASVQEVVEEVVLRLATHAQEITGASNLCLAGGVALNSVANGRLARSGMFDEIWVQPAAGDSGGALGAALLVGHRRFGLKRKLPGKGRDSQRASRLGPSFPSSEVRHFLDRNEYPYVHFEDEAELAKRVAQEIAQGRVVGLFAGRMEFGPRALGGRSIIADPRNAEMQVHLNLKIKNRESFRPFAPAVLREHAGKYFVLPADSPYMLLVVPVREEQRLTPASDDDAENDDLLAVVRQNRSSIPAVTHVDYSARVQTVCEEDHPEFWRILDAFYQLTGCPVLVNTSFNVRGEPIVLSPEDAYQCFLHTEMDILILGDCLLVKEDQTAMDEVFEFADEEEAAGQVADNELLQTFYDQEVVPVADQIRARDVQLLTIDNDENDPTWYTSVSEDEELCEIDEDLLLGSLQERWESQGLPELAGLAPGLLELAEEMAAASDDEDDEGFSSTIYRMF